MEPFRSWVELNAVWFRGVHPETEATLDAAEAALKLPLPPTLRWLLREWGYSAACGIDSLAEAVSATLRCRNTIGLPDHVVILNDWGDAGVVVLVGTTDEPDRWPILWLAEHNLIRLATNEPLDADHERFDGYSAWVAARLAAEKEIALSLPP